MTDADGQFLRLGATNPMPALSPDEREALRASIEAEGVMVPIITSAGPALFGEIVDGFNRLEIWRELGKPEAEIPRVSRSFATEAEFRIAQIDLNARRRQLTVPQRIMLAMAREPWEKKLAAQRMRELAAKRGPEKLPQGSRGDASRATALAAEAVGLKRDTYEHGRLVLEKAPTEIREQFVAGKISVNRAYTETKRALGIGASATLTKSVAQRLGSVPNGSYGALLVTPPWRSGSRAFEAGRVLPAELGALDVRRAAGKDAVVALVAPARWLREAFDVVATWGASVVTVVVKVRAGAANGAPIAERAEFVIVGTFGAPKLPETGRENVVETDAQLFGLLDALVPDREGIVLFGETNRPGWESWSPRIK